MPPPPAPDEVIDTSFASLIRSIDPTEYESLFEQREPRLPPALQTRRRPRREHHTPELLPINESTTGENYENVLYNALAEARRPDNGAPSEEARQSLIRQVQRDLRRYERGEHDVIHRQNARIIRHSRGDHESSELTSSEEDEEVESSEVESVVTDRPVQNMSSRRENTTTASRPSRPRRRTAGQAFQAEASDADGEAGTNASSTAGPSRKRTRTTNTTAQAQAGSSRQAEPIVIDDLDTSSDDNLATYRMKETLQRQREEAVKAQQAAASRAAGEEMPRLNKLQCVICMDSFTDMTATSCGHIFCNECLVSALRASENRRNTATGQPARKSQCPVCRTNLNRQKGGDVIPLLIMKKGLATQPRRPRGAAAG